MSSIGSQVPHYAISHIVGVSWDKSSHTSNSATLSQQGQQYKSLDSPKCCQCTHVHRAGPKWCIQPNSEKFSAKLAQENFPSQLRFKIDNFHLLAVPTFSDNSRHRTHFTRPSQHSPFEGPWSHPWGCWRRLRGCRACARSPRPRSSASPGGRACGRGHLWHPKKA